MFETRRDRADAGRRPHTTRAANEALVSPCARGGRARVWRERDRRDRGRASARATLVFFASRVDGMKTYAQTIDLLPGKTRAYVELHARVWPEVLRSLRDVGVVDMKIYVRGSRAFMVMWTTDAFDPEVDFARHMAMSARCVEWGELTRTFQRPVVDARPGEWWCRMEEAFDMGAQLARLDEAEREG